MMHFTLNGDDETPVAKPAGRLTSWIRAHEPEVVERLTPEQREALERGEQVVLHLSIAAGVPTHGPVAAGHAYEFDVYDITDAADTEAVDVVGPEAPAAPLPDEPLLSAPDEEADDELVSPPECARRIGRKTGQTVRNNIDAGHVIGWRSGSSHWVVPMAQFGPAPEYRFIPGLRDLLRYFETPAEAWRWMKRPNRRLDHETPLACLHAGRIDEVRRAAAQYDDGAFT